MKWSSLKQPLILPSACFGELSIDAVLDPVRIPPVDGRDHASTDEHREVKVIAAGEAGRVAEADRLPARYLVAGFYIERHKMSVQRLHAHAVIENDRVAVNPEPGGVQNDAVVGRGNGDVRGDR